MKKYLFSALALGMMLTSCQSDEPFAPGEGGEKQVTFTLNVPGDLGTRAVSGESGAQNNENANIYYTLVLDANGDKQVLQETTKEKTVTFTTPVVLGRKYDITAYASYTNNIDATASNIKAIAVEKSFNDETKDAYTAHVEDHDFALSALPTMQLKRPFGKLRLIATDYVETGTAKNTAIDQVTITYNNTTATTYDATTTLFNNVGTGITATKDFVKYYDAESDGMPIFADYLPANREDNPITFTVTVRYAGSTETYSRTFNDIPVRRNALTTLKGDFFTAGAEIIVNVDENFDKTKAENRTFVSNAAQLQEAINNAPAGESVEIIMEDDIELTQALIFGTPTVRSGETITQSFVLDLNGKTLETGLEREGRHYYAINNYANLVIEGEGAINARGIQNFGELTVNGNVTVSNVDTNGGAAIWNEGKVTINNGTFISSENAGAESDGAALNIRANASAIVNNGVFRSEATHCYAILCGGELTIKNADVKGKHGAVAAFGNANIIIEDGKFEQLDNPNISDHCIFGKGYASDANNRDVTLNIYGGQYKIEDCAEKNGGTVFWGECLAEGYSAIEVDGWYKVVKFEDNFAENSWENIILACQLNKVKDTWNVGDKKTMTIGENEYEIAIIGKNHDTYTAGGKAPLTFQLAEVYGTTAKMNETQTNTTGWSGSAMRNTTMPAILSAMPSEVHNAIKAVNKETLNGTRDGLETTSDKLFLLSEIEVNGSVYFSNNFAEGSRYPYYTDLNSQIMNLGKNPATWWLRGPGKNNAIGFTQINMSGYMANGSAEYACGVVFGFCF